MVNYCARNMLRMRLVRLPCGFVRVILLSALVVGYSEGQDSITVGGTTFSCTAVGDSVRRDCGFPGITTAECVHHANCCYNSNAPGIPHCFFGNNDNRCSNLNSRTDCGFRGVTRRDCVLDWGCCWDSSIENVPWCFRDADDNRCVVSNRIPCGRNNGRRNCVRRDCCYDSSTRTCFFPADNMQCAIPEIYRLQCGPDYINQYDCEDMGCCFFDPSDPSDRTTPRCYLPLLPPVEPMIEPVSDCGADGRSLNLTCNIGQNAFNMSTSLGMNVTVTWRVNGMDMQMGTVEVGDLTNTIDAALLGNIFNQSVDCCLNFTNERNRSVFECSPPFVFTIEMTSSRARVREGEDVVVSFTTNGPALLWCDSTLTTATVVVSGAVSDVIFDQPDAEHNSTQVVFRTESDDRIVVTPCGFEVASFQCTRDNFQTAFQVRVRTLRDGKLEGNHTVVINFYVLRPAENCTELIGSLTIYIEDAEGSRNPVCIGYSHLQIETFDGTNFSFRKEGTFVFYRHETLPFEIFIRVEECDSPDGPFPCACEAVVTINGTSLIFSRCDDNNNTLEVLRDGGPLPTTAALVRHPDGQTFSIYFPHGGILTLYICVVQELPFLFLKYLPSRFDLQASVGLCGLYDGNAKNDFLSGCGVIGSIRDAHAFALSWRAFACTTGCQFTGNDVIVDGMQTIGPFCVCDIPHGNSFCIGDLTNTVDLNGTLPLKNKEIIDDDMLTQLTGTLEDRLRSNFSEVTLSIRKPPKAPANITLEEAFALCNSSIQTNISVDCVERLGSRLVASITRDCAAAVVHSNSELFVDFFVARIIQECRILLKHLLFDPGSSEKFGYKLCRCPEHDCDPFTGLCRCGTKGGRYGSCENSVLRVGYLSGNVLCDLSVESCQHVPVFGSNMRPDLDCEITDIQEVEKLTEGTELKSEAVEVTTATFLHEGQIDCYLGRPRPVTVNIDEDGQRLAGGDSQSRLFVPYDSRCFDCFTDFENKVSCTRRQAGLGCQVDGRCYGPYERSRSDDCLECRPAENGNRLLKRKTSECGGLQEERKLYSLFSLVVLFVAATVLTCVFYRIWLRRKQDKREADKYSNNPYAQYDGTLGFRGQQDARKIGFPTALDFRADDTWSSSRTRQVALGSSDGPVVSDG